MKTQAFKYRVVGAVFIVSLAVIIIPALLDQTPAPSSDMTEVVSHPLAFAKPSTPLEPSDYAFSDLVSTLKAEELAANASPAQDTAEPGKESVQPPSQAQAPETKKLVQASPQTQAQPTEVLASAPAAAPNKVSEKPKIAKAKTTAPTAASAPAPTVIAEALPPGHTPPAGVTPTSSATRANESVIQATQPAGKTSAWAVQMGAFTSEENANALVERLQDAGYSAYVYSRTPSDLLRVLVGVEQEKDKADQRLAELNTKLHMKGVVIPL